MIYSYPHAYQTHAAICSLVTSGAAKDVTSYIEHALQMALEAKKQFSLELQAFEDPIYAAHSGDTRHLQPFLGQAK